MHRVRGKKRVINYERFCYTGPADRSIILPDVKMQKQTIYEGCSCALPDSTEPEIEKTKNHDLDVDALSVYAKNEDDNKLEHETKDERQIPVSPAIAPSEDPYITHIDRIKRSCPDFESPNEEKWFYFRLISFTALKNINLYKW